MQGWKVAGKSWTAFVGALLVAVLPIIPTVAGVLPLPWGPILSGIGLILSAIAGKVAYHAPYAPITPVPVLPSGDTHTPWVTD